MTDSRQAAFLGLLRMETDQSYSNLVLDKIFTEKKLSPRDKAFAGALFRGVLERKLTLDFILSKYSRQSFEKTDKAVLTILRIGVYQLKFMDSVPDSAAVNESVGLARANRQAKAAGFINAVLRGFIRDGKELCLPHKSREEDLSIQYSCPAWLVWKWEKEYGEENTGGILQKSLETPPLTIRVNTLKVTAQDLTAYLEEEGVTVLPTSLENCLILQNAGEVPKLKAFQEGLFHVQDMASQLAVKALDVRPGMTVLDLCAAPGGKSFTAAEYLNKKGEVLSFDLYPHKVRLIEDGARRLGIENLKAAKADAMEFQREIPLADRVLCDVPCSGLGIIRRKPEIKYKPQSDLQAFPEMTAKILNNAARVVKPGGILLFSTCTLNKDENEGPATRFLKENCHFQPLPLGPNFDIFKCKHLNEVTLLPQEQNTDGFFMAAFTRIDQVRV